MNIKKGLISAESRDRSTGRQIECIALATGVLLALGVQTASAASRVNVMPDRQVRPGVSIPVWGNAGNGGVVGNGSANGEMYTWSFVPNPNVSVVTDGNLSGSVTNDRYIPENVSFALLNGSTREAVTATLDVGGTTKSVVIDIVSPSDPISDTPVENLDVNTNIAIENTKRYLYLQQQSNGRWLDGGSSIYECAVTGYAVWAFSNSGHPPTNDINSDIYAEWVQKGVNYILSLSQASAPVAQTNIGLPDANGNSRMISLCGSSFSSPVGYANPIATAALVAAYAANPDTLVPAGSAFAGETYKTVVHDAADWIAYAQTEGSSPNRGGWRYTANGGADTSADSWNYVALEGAEQLFGLPAGVGTLFDKVKTEAEHRINGSQSQSAPVGQFGYTGTTCLGSGCNADTGGGLSGLNLVTTGAHVPSLLNGGPLSSVTFPNVATRKAKAVEHLGNNWNVGANCWGGNLNNFYAMWTQARALRLNGTTTLVNAGTTFDWETGEEYVGGNPTGVLGGAGDPQEGYFAYLTRTQQADGSWATGTLSCSDDSFPANFNTALGLLVLESTVFGPAQCVDDLTARPKSGKVQLVWTDFGSPGYNVYRSTTSGGPYALIGSTASTYSTYLDAAVVNGTTYYYVVKPTNAAGGELCTSNQASAKPVAR